MPLCPPGLRGAVLDKDVVDDGMSLLQRRTYRTDTRTGGLPVVPAGRPSAVTWRIWTIDGPHKLQLPFNATFGEVDGALFGSGFGFGVGSLRPVSSGDFQLVAVPAGLPPHCVAALVQRPGRGNGLELIHVRDDVHSMSFRGGQGLLVLSLHGLPWEGCAQGLFHGMHIIAAFRKPTVLASARPVATPCRNVAVRPDLVGPVSASGLLESAFVDPASDAVPSRSVSLTDSLPRVPPHSISGLRTLLRSLLVPWLQGWTHDVSTLDLSPGLRAHFEHAPRPSLLPTAFWLFTDGSAGECTAGCGVVLCVEHAVGSDSLWSFLGWTGFACKPGTTNNEAESAAILLATTWALGVAWCVPVHVVADSWVASQSACGDCGIVNSQSSASVHQQARAVVQAHQAGHSLLCFDWVPSHCGIAANELADAVAKFFAGQGGDISLLPEAVHRFWQHPFLSWTWALFDQCGRPALETLDQSAYEPPDVVHSEHVAAVVRDTRGPVSVHTPCFYKLFTANVCSLRGKHQFLQHQLNEAGVAVCALQETRAHCASTLLADGWLRFGTACERGHFGVALWFRQSAFAQGSVLPTLEAFAVIQQATDWLAVRFKFGQLDWVVVALHAPHSGHSAEAIQAWWREAVARLDRLCGLAPIVLLGDANAVLSSVSGPAVGCLASSVPDLAGECFAAVLHRFDLAAVNTFPSRAFPDELCPTFGEKCIDYMCVPRRWVDGAEQVSCGIDLGTKHDDHDPVEVLLQLCMPKRKIRRGAKMRSGRQGRAPASLVPWQVDVHTHAEALFRRAKDSSRTARAVRAQKPFVSDATLQLLCKKRALRARLKRYRQAGVAGDDVAALVCEFRRAACLVSDAIRADKKAYLERVSNEIRDALDANEGHATWHALRFFRPANGKVKKPFRALPILVKEDGDPAESFEDQQATKAVFFAAMEAASTVLPDQTRTCPDGGFSLLEVPTLVEVENCIRRMPKRKAPGPSGIANEHWQHHVPATAREWMELVLKMHKRGTEPFRLSAGLLHTLYKGKGDLCDISNHRSIFLLEGIGKALRKLVRPAVLQVARAHQIPLLFGATPGSQSAFLTHYLLTFQRLARRKGVSSSILFVDVRSAYYRVLRQRLLGQRLSDQSMCELLRVMRVPPEALQAVLRWASEPALTTEMSTHQRFMLEALFQNPCFLLRGLDQPFFSRCGTRPGDSLADALFCVVFADCLSALRQRLDAEGLLTGPGFSRAVQPTWADDLAVPVCGPAADIVAKSQALCQAVHEVLGARALDVNYNAGKTELLTSWHGNGARTAKRRVLSGGDTLAFDAFGVGREVRLSFVYTHLGTKLCDSLACTADLKCKAAKALANTKPLAARVLRCPDLALVHRRRFLCSLGLSVLGYNAAVWMKLTAADCRLWAQAVDSLARLLLPDDRWSDSPDHPTVYEICGAVGLPEPRALFSQFRILHLLRIVVCNSDVLWDLLVEEAAAGESSWLEDLRVDFQWLAYWAPSPVVQSLPTLP